MAISLSEDQVRLLHLRAQRLTAHEPGAVTSVAGVVKELCGLQAQDARAATLGVRVRGAGLVASDVEQARVQERSVVRTWGQRGTLHLLATEDLGWLLPLFGPVFVAGDRRRRAELGLDEETCSRAIRALCEVLARQGPLSRDELVEQLAAHGIPLEGQARPHLLSRAALEGIICFGPDYGTEPTYVLLSDWIDQEQRGRPLAEDAAYAELARRYLKAYGPAAPEDLAAWSGLPASKLRRGWQQISDELLEVKITGLPAWMLKTRAAWLDEPLTHAPVVRLLPSFDTYLLGYRSRELVVAAQFARRINAGGGILHPTLLLDGRAVGIWKGKRQKNYLEVIVEPFEQLAPEVIAGVEAEVADLARFLEVKTTWQVMAPS